LTGSGPEGFMGDPEVKSINIKVLVDIQNDSELSRDPTLRLKIPDPLHPDSDFAAYDSEGVIKMDGNGNLDLTFDEFVDAELNKYYLCRKYTSLCRNAWTLNLLQGDFEEIAGAVKKIETRLAAIREKKAK
jgi:hypothetical protein